MCSRILMRGCQFAVCSHMLLFSVLLLFSVFCFLFSVFAGLPQYQQLQTYPNCYLSTTTIPSLSAGQYALYGCLNVPAGNVWHSVTHSNDYIDFEMVDEQNQQNLIDDMAYSCICSAVCFKQGSASSATPNPKFGTCTLSATTTNVYAVIFNRNSAFSVTSLSFSAIYPDASTASSSTGSAAPGASFTTSLTLITILQPSLHLQLTLITITTHSYYNTTHCLLLRDLHWCDGTRSIYPGCTHVS